MKQINLKSSEFKYRKEGGGGTALLIGIVLIVASLAVSGWKYYEQKQLDGKILAVKNEIEEKNKSLESPEFKVVYNLESRILELKSQMELTVEQSEQLEAIRQVTFPEIYFESLGLSSEGTRDVITAQVLAPNYDFLARQMRAFSSIKGSSEPKLASSSAKEVQVGAEKKTLIGASIEFEIATKNEIEEVSEEETKGTTRKDAFEELESEN